ncbi:hypothetical protein [Streptomyces hygroscopicus]|uniref:hypothetical protein n=1 Tax=Streptomyces hygroscopicus TaxID=1912 RepID=UPI00223EB55F|nr:hypothetical protein [Streptomyces hygroscopicus]
MNGKSPSQRGIWLAIILLASLGVAAVAGALFHLAGAAAPTVMGASGAAFMGVASLGLAAHRFIAE